MRTATIAPPKPCRPPGARPAPLSNDALDIRIKAARRAKEAAFGANIDDELCRLFAGDRDPGLNHPGPRVPNGRPGITTVAVLAALARLGPSTTAALAREIGRPDKPTRDALKHLRQTRRVANEPMPGGPLGMKLWRIIGPDGP
jgi:hypothetical protein